MPIHSLVTPGEFDAQAIAAMGEAFDAAYTALDDPGPPKIVLEVIAERIVEAARRGERDPVRLVKPRCHGLTDGGQAMTPQGRSHSR
jgi:hypothetical protein